MVRVLDAIDAFLDRLESVDYLPLAVAIACHLAKMACASMAWRNVLAAAYPAARVRWTRIYAAYLVGVGINAIVPARAGDVARVVLAHQAVSGSTYTTVFSSTLLLAAFDMVVASALLTWAVTQGALPGLDALPDLESLDFAWLLSHPLVLELGLAGIAIALAVLGIWIAGHVANFWGRVNQAFTVARRPSRYFREVASWQAAEWLLRFATIWFLLDAFDIPQSLRAAALTQVSQSSATLLPLTPGGIGTEQAFLVYVLQGAAPATVLLAFSVGARLTITATNVVAGFTALALTLRTLRYRRALEGAPADHREPVA